MPKCSQCSTEVGANADACPGCGAAFVGSEHGDVASGTYQFGSSNGPDYLERTGSRTALTAILVLTAVLVPWRGMAMPVVTVTFCLLYLGSAFGVHRRANWQSTLLGATLGLAALWNVYVGISSRMAIVFGVRQGYVDPLSVIVGWPLGYIPMTSGYGTVTAVVGVVGTFGSAVGAVYVATLGRE